MSLLVQPSTSSTHSQQADMDPPTLFMNTQPAQPPAWPAFTDTVFNSSGKFVGITYQSLQIHKLLMETNTHHTPFVLCWDYAFPPPGPFRSSIMRNALLRAAAALNYREIGDRLHAEPDYVDVLGSSICSLVESSILHVYLPCHLHSRI